MLNTDFQLEAKKTLDELADLLDKFDSSGDLELEYSDGIITITLLSGKQFIINKHAPSSQIWLSSPLSGGLHFSRDVACCKWKLNDGRDLYGILAGELKSIAGIDIDKA